MWSISFNPRICKRCDDEDGNAYKVDFVSIHASVKDATAAILNNRRFDLVSIHASVKDATDDPVISGLSVTVSIHASVKDATIL